MIKNEIIEKVENIAINGDTDQTKLNALNLLLSYEISLEKEAELEKKHKEEDEKFKERIKNLTAGLMP